MISLEAPINTPDVVVCMCCLHVVMVAMPDSYAQKLKLPWKEYTTMERKAWLVATPDSYTPVHEWLMATPDSYTHACSADKLIAMPSGFKRLHYHGKKNSACFQEHGGLSVECP